MLSTLGIRVKRRKPRKVERAPKSMVRAKAMMMKGGMEMIGFPPVIRGQLREVRMVKANPVNVPETAPERAKILTFERFSSPGYFPSALLH
jgi:hypothetical protein